MNKHLIGIMIAVLITIGMTGGHASAASVHTVKSGDTLWEIAQKNNVAVEDLLSWNELQSALIFPGQEIKIGNKGEFYIVQKGDTLAKIAEKNQVALTDLMGWNGISGHLIYPGDELSIDGVGKKIVRTATPQPKEKQTVSAQTNETITTAASGKEMTVTATAYTAYCAGCSGTTYTGIDLRANPNQKVIAVDPNVIPLGSRVWVEGYGEAIAGDIGGAIKGNIIDVFLESKQDAYNWGRRTVKIKVLN